MQPEALINLRLLELSEILQKERAKYRIKAILGLSFFMILLFIYCELIIHKLLLLPGDMVDTLIGLTLTSLIIFFLSYIASPFFINHLLKPKPIVLQFYPEFKKIIEILLKRSNIKSVDFYVSHHLSKNAMVYTEAGRYRVVFADDIMDLLTPEEFAGVLGHELGHIYNNDLYLNGMLWLGFRILCFIKKVSLVIIVISSRLLATLSKAREQFKNWSNSYSNFTAVLLALPVAFLLFIIGVLLLALGLFLNLGVAIFNWINRSREYAADLYSAIYTSPHAVCQGLKKIYYLNQNKQAVGFRFPEYCTLANEFDSMSQPDIFEMLKGLLASHPFTYNRLRRLRKYETIEERIFLEARDYSAIVKFPCKRIPKARRVPPTQLTLPFQ
ncbi:MAG: M48 family metalloprotease [Candidatus Coatesbacteria bacterium]|nr:M48 family metalloprotease [Candidatus Coatesbacteria bacterium]